MKKLVVTIGATLLVTAGAAPSPAGAARGAREATLPYAGPAYAVSVSTPIPSSTLGGYCDPGTAQPPSNGCVRFPVKKGDHFLSLRIEDLTTLPVLGAAVDSHGQVLGLFCGATEKPFQLLSGTAYIDVWAVAGNCPSVTQPSVPTTGTITATFSRRSR